MTSLDNIEEFLEIDLTQYRLRNGKKDESKNRYYWNRGQWYIVELSNNKWMIMSSNQQTRDLLTNHIWFHNHGYSKSKIKVNGSWKVILIHREILDCDNNLCIDHINRNKFDNRVTNLRAVTVGTNNKNRTKPSNNTSGKIGVCRYVRAGSPVWVSRIVDNNGKRIDKAFYINKLGEDEAKRQATLQRQAWEEEYNYLGD